MEGKALKGCPIGTQTFEVLREGDMLYIDKTEYIHRMVHSANRYFFLSRPRRFGKSLLTSILKLMRTRRYIHWVFRIVKSV